MNDDQFPLQHEFNEGWFMAKDCALCHEPSLQQALIKFTLD